MLRFDFIFFNFAGIARIKSKPFFKKINSMLWLYTYVHKDTLMHIKIHVLSVLT